MTDRTTITIDTDTKEWLDDIRDDRKWGRFLREEIQTNSTDDVNGDNVNDKELNEEIRKLQELVEQMPSRTVDLMEGRFQ